jgi:hypothetical protein
LLQESVKVSSAVFAEAKASAIIFVVNPGVANSYYIMVNSFIQFTIIDLKLLLNLLMAIFCKNKKEKEKSLD